MIIKRDSLTDADLQRIAELAGFSTEAHPTQPPIVIGFVKRDLDTGRFSYGIPLIDFRAVAEAAVALWDEEIDEDAPVRWHNSVGRG